MDFNSLDQAGYLALLKQLQGIGAYSDDDTANVNREWNGVAKIAALVSTVLEAASKNMFLSQANELLPKLEKLFYLPSDERLTTTQRQSRLLAFARALPKMVEARIDAAFDAYLVTSSGPTVAPTPAQAATAGAPASAGLYLQRRESTADATERRTLDPILARGLPARAMGGKLSTGNATFGSGSIDRLSINTTPAVSPATQTKANAAVYEYFPGSVIDANEWLEIQSMLLWKSRGFTVSQTSQGRTIVAAGSITAGATVILDGPTHGGAEAINWHNRFTQARGIISTVDVTPGGAFEDIATPNPVDAVWLPPAKLGNAGAAYTHPLTPMSGAAQAELSVNASGDLTMTSLAGGTLYFVLMIRCTPAHTVASSTDTQPWASTVDITNAVLQDVARSAAIRSADGGGAGWTKESMFGTNRGALRRILYTGPLGKVTQAGNLPYVVLDSSEDWRNRYLLVSAVTRASMTECVAGSTSGFAGRSGTTNGNDLNHSAPRLFYTGAGAALGNLTELAYQLPDTVIDKNVWLYADSATGDLLAEMKGTDSNDDYAACLFMVTASEPVDGSSVATPVPLHATQVHALDLNQPQNNGCFAQGLQGGVPRYLATSDDHGTEPTNPPLGLVAEGSGGPRRPVQHRVRERVGRVDDSTWLCRQKLVGQRKRIVSVTVPDDTLVYMDLSSATGIQPGYLDQVDFRDRLISIEGRYSSTDITVYHGGAGQTDDSASFTRFAATFYSGPYADQVIVAGDLTFTMVFSRGIDCYHSRLHVVQTTGATLYLNLSIEVTGYLGLTDRRLFGAVS